MIVTDITKIGDPQVVLHNGTYYCYATSCCCDSSNDAGYLVWESDDLIHWKQPKVCFRGTDFWGKSLFWAPEVVYHNGKFIMHYTALSRKLNSLRIGVAVSDNPLGPFIDVHNAPMFDFGFAALDGSVLVSDKGNYLYYSCDRCDKIIDQNTCDENAETEEVKVSEIYCVKLDDTLTETVGEPWLVATPDKDFELKSINVKHLWNEGPTVIFRNGKYIMNYSANFFASNDYAICVAVADNPEGPWIKSINNPVSLKSKDLFGAGHNAFFYGKDGELYTSFHIQTNPKEPSGDRRVVIGKVEFSEKQWEIYETIE